ncbi:hypothetical protein K503DRAFT_794997 [Rhizopogon vinicolor AM-OR11-026]|uniref:Uncharacterized protein n=1 Tax=Rhizopogon vinicolor AM-OR11-026 TaxID=1314800 RepID=A0A1B7ME31_9AGAM|nr:hypothetical protein K503DRAFT_794997 [Rhizopogon vinicolor AM-OR11-026]
MLHKGIFKDYLVKWCLDIVVEDEMNAHFKAMPNYPGLQHFKTGISTVKQWMGTEHKEMQRVFLGLLAGAVPRLLVVAQAILDFSYYTQLWIHMAESLNGLDSALAIFHTNKDILQELQVHKHFNIPKLHQLSHYVQSILLFGSADGFNTKLPERLHIDFAKEAYRASNKHNYEEQMALWLQCQEAVFLRGSYLDWLLEQSRLTPNNCTDHEHGYESDSDSEMEGPGTVPNNAHQILPTITSYHVVHVLTKSPAHPRQSIQYLVTTHGATMFPPALKLFLREHMPYNSIVPVVIIAPPDPWVRESPRQWCIRATPEVHPGPGHKPGSPARFDMALTSDSIQTLNLCTLESQVCVIFTLPRQFGTYSQPLAYIEWFTPFREPDPSSGLHQMSCST